MTSYRSIVDGKQLTFVIMENGSTPQPTDQDYFDLTIGKEVIVKSYKNSYTGVLECRKHRRPEHNVYSVYGDNSIVFSFSDVVNAEQARMTEIIKLKGI